MALFPLGFGIAFAPRGTKEVRWASPFPQLSLGVAVGRGPLWPGLPTGLSLQGPWLPVWKGGGFQHAQIAGAGSREGQLGSLLLGEHRVSC